MLDNPFEKTEESFLTMRIAEQELQLKSVELAHAACESAEDSYCSEYVEGLEKLAEKMCHTLQMVSSVNNKTGRVSPEVTAEEVQKVVLQFHEFKHGWDND